ncbi:MAG: flagellar protein FlgN [Betaproteobacteria bacterium]|nr:flagellar protein FlgN [Betaproteobacteria bacterium]NBY04578.1 flagellar protein FlgN [Betaproteobacteria bacterium]
MLAEQVLAPDDIRHTEALSLVDELESLLEAEFDALKAQDLDRFEVLLEQKNQVLERLSQLSGVRQPEDADRLGVEWDTFKSRMVTCRDMHRRNEILIVRKLDAIRGTLQSLVLEDPASSVEVYDRLGKINRMRRRRGYSDA